MIFTGLINLLYLIVHALFALVPDAITFPQAFHSAVAGIGNYLWVYNAILPVQELFNIFAFMLIVMSTWFVIKMVGIVVSIVRGNPNPVQ